ncbi:hypothetical protein P4S55_20305 [Shewanella sp. PP-Sp27a-2]
MPSQEDICKKFNASYTSCLSSDKLGVALETLGKLPINGVRHKAENGTCGWYIWCGEDLSEDVDFFKPLHVSHVGEYLPEVEAYLSLPEGYRFLLAGDYEDVWYDSGVIGM